MLDLSKLNKNQREAVVTTEGPVMVMAGAGSGKTRVLTYRIAYLIDELGVSPSSILAVTFTNKAAREMKERVEDLLNTQYKDMWISTFHSFGARFLRREIGLLKDYTRLFNIIDDDDEEKIIKNIVKEHEFDVSYKEAMYYISAIKNLEIVKKDNNNVIYDKIYQYYQEQLIRDNLLDFDDLLYLTYKILKSDDYIKEKYQQMFNYILVDEFQDTNKIQFELINLLTNQNNNIFIVGDINQSIYSFRGARIENINHFRKNFSALKIIKLEENYRSSKEILDVANSVIKENNSFVDMHLFTNNITNKRPKVIQTESNYGEVTFVINEIRKLLTMGYHYKDIAIMYRINSLSLGFETEFIKEHIPFIIYGGVSYFERREVKDVLAYLRLIINPNDDFSLKRIINVPKRKIGEKLLATLDEKRKGTNKSLFDSIDEKESLNLVSFKKMILELQEDLKKVTLVDLIDLIIKKSGYLEDLKKKEEDDRIDNVLELKTIMKDLMDTHQGEDNTLILQNFLLDLSLRTDVDNIKESDDMVKLMSYHQAKGLEYKVVFMVSTEQGIFPSSKVIFSLNSLSEIEEERRIFYVGVTRAKELLYITYAKYRRLYGVDSKTTPSQFLDEVDKNLLDYQAKSHAYMPNNFNPVRKKEEKDEFFDEDEIDVGNKIKHKAFGEGLVVGREGDIITVAFKVPFGIKKLLRTHPMITKIK